MYVIKVIIINESWVDATTMAQKQQESQSQKFIQMENLTLKWKKTLKTNVEWDLCGD